MRMDRIGYAVEYCNSHPGDQLVFAAVCDTSPTECAVFDFFR